MIQKSRTYIYTTAIPPFICYALIKILEDPIFLRQKSKLQNLITYFDAQLNTSERLKKRPLQLKYLWSKITKNFRNSKKALKKYISLMHSSTYCPSWWS